MQIQKWKRDELLADESGEDLEFQCAQLKCSSLSPALAGEFSGRKGFWIVPIGIERFKVFAYS